MLARKVLLAPIVSTIGSASHTSAPAVLTTSQASYHRNNRDAEYVAIFKNLFNNNPGASRILSDFANTFHVEKLPQEAGDMVITSTATPTLPDPARRVDPTETSRHRHAATSPHMVLEHNLAMAHMQNVSYRRDQYSGRYAPPGGPVVGSLRGRLQSMPSAYWHPSAFRSEDRRALLRGPGRSWREQPAVGARMGGVSFVRSCMPGDPSCDVSLSNRGLTRYANPPHLNESGKRLQNKTSAVGTDITPPKFPRN